MSLTDSNFLDAAGDSIAAAHVAPRVRPWRLVGTFLVCFFLLQLLWNCARGTWIEHWVIDRATVRTSASLVNAFTPQQQAVARGSTLVGRDGTITVRRGCEGTETLFLLIAALLAYPLSRPVLLIGLAGGLGLVFALNQVRLLALYYALHRHPLLFGELHGLVMPLMLIAFTAAFFVALLGWDRQRSARAG
jgi:exosortase/archaeosortase family protein